MPRLLSVTTVLMNNFTEVMTIQTAIMRRTSIMISIMAMLPA